MLLITMCIFQIKELFQVKNGLITSLPFFWKMTKIGVGRTTLNEEKKRGSHIPPFVMTSNMRQWCHLGIQSSLFHSGNHPSSGVL